MAENWYESLAKKGYLGTKAQVSATQGNPTWKSQASDDSPKPQDKPAVDDNDQISAMKRRMAGS